MRVLGFVSRDSAAKQNDGDFDDHIRSVFACRACPGVLGEPVTGAVRGARVVLVGQAPGNREIGERRPFAWTAGHTLFRWFSSIGVEESAFRSRVHIAAVIRCFPGKNGTGGGDRVPDRDEIARCATHLDRDIALLRPGLIIAVGALAAQQLIGDSVLSRVVGVTHRAERAGVRFDAVVLPHPSGRSTWLNAPSNRTLLERSLQQIAGHSAFRETFW
jgi:uracil-DNA glycosylase